jgi:ribonuclease Y
MSSFFDSPLVMGLSALSFLFFIIIVFLQAKVGKINQNAQIKIDQQKNSILQQVEQYRQQISKDFELKLKQELELERKSIDIEVREKLKDYLLKEEEKHRQELKQEQEKVRLREAMLDEKFEEMFKTKKELANQELLLQKKNQELIEKDEELKKKISQIDEKIELEIEKIAGLSKEEAEQKLLEKTKLRLGQELVELQHKIVNQTEEVANIKAREIVALAIQRCSSEVANEQTITSIKLPDEETKGKLIGKGGRNIQWLEKTLGVELIIDDTPETVTISGFSSIRRHLAKKTLEKLVLDGRIHPASIEEMYLQAKGDIATEIAEAGEWAMSELQIYDFPAKLVRIIGRLKFRTSYGQNMLKHSVEMAKLAGLLADEMNEAFYTGQNKINRMICVKGALLHDVGKAVDEEFENKGDHIELGEKICDMFGLDWRIKKCVSSHHNESYYDDQKGFCIEAVLVDACDNISGGRPGARKETAEAYLQRVEGLEKIANQAEGVNKSFVMRGSRELWVFFDGEQTTLDKMQETTEKIAHDISSSVKSPMQIKVVGFLENRVVRFAI